MSLDKEVLMDKEKSKEDLMLEVLLDIRKSESARSVVYVVAITVQCIAHTCTMRNRVDRQKLKADRRDQ